MRSILDEAHTHPAIRSLITGHHAAAVRDVQAAIAAHPVVVVGMRGYPFVKKARKALARAGIAAEYIEYGSYLGQWRRRNALKMWTGWPPSPWYSSTRRWSAAPTTCRDSSRAASWHACSDPPPKAWVEVVTAAADGVT